MRTSGPWGIDRTHAREHTRDSAAVIGPQQERADDMGEKGNITSGELAAGGGAVMASAGTHATAVFQDAGESIKDKILDKGADAGITGAQEKWRARKESDDTSAPEAEGPAT